MMQFTSYSLAMSEHTVTTTKMVLYSQTKGVERKYILYISGSVACTYTVYPQVQ